MWGSKGIQVGGACSGDGGGMWGSNGIQVGGACGGEGGGHIGGRGMWWGRRRHWAGHLVET